MGSDRVARMKRSEIRGPFCAHTIPDYAALHPGYDRLAHRAEIAPINSANASVDVIVRT